MTEPDVASSDATNIRTSIRREGDNYVINGRKWFITGAADPRCKICILMGVTDPDAPAPWAPPACAWRRRPTPGVDGGAQSADHAPHGPRGPPRDALRQRSGAVRQPPGRAGQGFRARPGSAGPGRIHHCMRSIGQCAPAIEPMCAHAAERETFGQKRTSMGHGRRVDRALPHGSTRRASWCCAPPG